MQSKSNAPFRAREDSIGSRRFPLLSRQAGLDPETRADLTLSDVEFGRKYKRGKAARMELLESMENRLAVVALRAEVDELIGLKAQLEALISANEHGLVQSLATPRTTAEAEVVFWLSFLELGPAGPEFVNDLGSMKDALRDTVSGELAIAVFRDLITATDATETAQTVADRFDKVRQAIYDRQDRMIEKLDEIVRRVDFDALTKYLRENAIVSRGGKLCASIAHPLVAAATMDRGVFPSVHDVVALGLWAVARKESVTKKSFRRSTSRTDELEITL